MTARERHLTVEDLAARCGVSVKTVYRWNHTGAGPGRIRPAGGQRGKVAYRLADVEAWEAARVVQPARMKQAQAAPYAA